MITEITKEQEAHMSEYVRRGVEAGLCTEQQSDDEIRRIARRLDVEFMGRSDDLSILVANSPIAAWMMVCMFSGDQVGAQVRDQVWDQVGDQVRDQVWAQVGDQVRDQVWAQVWAQVRDQVWDQVGDQVGAQVRAQVGAQVRAQVGDQVRDQVWDQVRDFIWPYIEGNFDSPYISFLSYIIEVLGATAPEKWEPYRESLQIGLYCPIKSATIVCRRPSEIHRNKSGDLHHDGGMALSYPDGWGFWALNGVRVPQEIAETPAEDLDPGLALKETNTEIRREIIRKVGVERFIEASGAETLDNSSDGVYELLEVELAEGVKARYLKMVNPSIGVYHVEGVGDECRTVDEALDYRKPDAMRAIPVDESGEDWYQQGDVCVWPREAKSLKRRPKILT